MEAMNGSVYAPRAANSLDFIEIPFYYLGLNTIPKRFLAGTVGTAALLYAIRPDFFFYQDGTARGFKGTGNEDGGTYLPWWALSLGVGTVFATFI